MVCMQIARDFCQEISLTLELLGYKCLQSMFIAKSVIIFCIPLTFLGNLYLAIKLAFIASCHCGIWSSVSGRKLFWHDFI